MYYQMKAKLNKSFDCTLFSVCSEHLIFGLVSGNVFNFFSYFNFIPLSQLHNALNFHVGKSINVLHL